MTNPWPIPGSAGELRDLPVHVKPDWRGAIAKIVGAVLWLLEKCGSSWATTVLDRFVQVISGRIYAQRGRDLKARPLSASLKGHEAIHDWQARTRGKVRYTIGYGLSRRYRRQAEAMAYGYQVAMHGRNPENAAKSAADPVYGMRWTRAEARTMIEVYAELFSAVWTQR